MFSVALAGNYICILEFHPLLLKLHFDPKIQVNVAKDIYSCEGCFSLLPFSKLNHPQRFV